MKCNFDSELVLDARFMINVFLVLEFNHDSTKNLVFERSQLKDDRNKKNNHLKF